MIVDSFGDFFSTVPDVAEAHARDAVDVAIALDISDVYAFGGFHQKRSALFGEDGLVGHSHVHVFEHGLAKGFGIVGGGYLGHEGVISWW